MEKIDPQITPVPPRLFGALKAGFDTIANQVVIILIPVALDLLLWLGPHLQVKSLLNRFLDAMVSSPDVSSLQTGDLLTTSVELMRTAATQLNLLSLLRTIPVGIPSLMAARLPIQTPAGSPLSFDFANLWVVIGSGLGLLLAGLALGSLFYNLVSQAALNNKIEFGQIFKDWFRSSIQVISLAVSLLILFVVVSIPASCVISAITLMGLPLGQLAVFLYFGVLLWLAFPLLFSAHGIFVNHNNALLSVQRSLLLTRMTLPTTALFFLSILALSQGLDMLWRVPPEASWLTLVGVGGHAFISSALLAASFVYYRDADQWVQVNLQLLKAHKDLPLHGS